MTTTEAPAVLIYARQSLDNQASKDEQEQAGLARAEAEGWTVGGVYRDGVSASRHANGKRVEWPRLLAELDRAEVGVLWLWESSRGDRTLTSWSAMLDRCREHRVSIYVETHGRLYDLRNAREWRTLAEDGVDSAYESEKTSTRVIRSMAAMAKAGKPHGRTPYGYTRKYALSDTGKRVLVGQVPDPAQARVVRRIFGDLARGVSLRSIAADLNAKGVPTVTGAAWSPQRVRDIALTITYAGKRSHNPEAKSGHARRHSLGAVTDATWPALVSLEDFHYVRTMLLDPKRRTVRPGRARHLLSMIATCGVCGGPLTVRFDRNKDGDYYCRDTGHVRAPLVDLDDYVTSKVHALLADTDEYRRLTAEEADSDRLRAARDELAAIRAHHGEMVTLLATRKLSAGAFADAEPQVLAELARAEAAVSELESPTSLRHLLGGEHPNLGKRWQAMPPVAKRQIVRALVDHIVVGPSPSAGRRLPIGDRVDFAMRTAPARRPAKAGTAKVA